MRDIDPGWARPADWRPSHLSVNGRRFIRDKYGEQRPVLLCAAAIVWNDRRQLLTVSRKDDSTAFTLPGGKVDDEDFGLPGRSVSTYEASKRAAARELLEETGVRATDLEIVFEDYDTGDHYTKTFWVKQTEGKVRTDEPHVVRWSSPGALLDSPFADYYRRLFKELGIRP